MSRSPPTENSVECGRHDMGAREQGRLDVGMPWGNVSLNMIFEIAHKLNVTCAILRFMTETFSERENQVKLPLVTLNAGVPVETRASHSGCMGPPGTISEEGKKRGHKTDLLLKRV